MNTSQQLPSRDDVFWFMNSRVTVRRASAANPDGLSILEHVMPHGDSPPQHVHRSEDEVFHILEGVMRLRVGDREITAGAGDTIVAPKNIPHTFRVESASGVRVLTIITGPGFEAMMRALSRPAGAETLPERVVPTPEFIEALTRTAARHGIDIVGPPIL